MMNYKYSPCRPPNHVPRLGHDCAATSGRTQRILQHLHGPHMASTGASRRRFLAMAQLCSH